MERRFVINVWCSNHRVPWVRDEVELRKLAEELAVERNACVTYAEVLEGKAVVLGHVSKPGQAPASKPPLPPGITPPKAVQIEIKREPPRPALVVSPTPLPLEPPTPAEIQEYIERISLLD